MLRRGAWIFLLLVISSHNWSYLAHLVFSLAGAILFLVSLWSAIGQDTPVALVYVVFIPFSHVKERRA